MPIWILTLKSSEEGGMCFFNCKIVHKYKCIFVMARCVGANWISDDDKVDRD